MEGSAAQYEFTPSQSTLIDSLARRMRLVGWWQMAFGVLSVIGGVVSLSDGGFGSVVTGAVLFLFGLWTLRAHHGFARVVETEGSDITHLMDALGELHKLFTLFFYLVVVGLSLIGIFVVLAVIVGVVTSLKG